MLSFYGCLRSSFGSIKRQHSSSSTESEVCKRVSAARRRRPDVQLAARSDCTHVHPQINLAIERRSVCEAHVFSKRPQSKSIRFTLVCVCGCLCKVSRRWGNEKHRGVRGGRVRDFCRASAYIYTSRPELR